MNAKKSMMRNVEIKKESCHAPGLPRIRANTPSFPPTSSTLVANNLWTMLTCLVVVLDLNAVDNIVDESIFH